MKYNPKYEKGKIYKIVDENEVALYVGSTTCKLCVRLSIHKYHAKLGHLTPICKKIRELDYKVKIVLIKNFPCTNAEELNKEERKECDVIGFGNLCNVRVPGGHGIPRKYSPSMYTEKVKATKRRYYERVVSAKKVRCVYCDKDVFVRDVNAHNNRPIHRRKHLAYIRNTRELKFKAEIDYINHMSKAMGAKPLVIEGYDPV
jgi:hypothetical protein